MPKTLQNLAPELLLRIVRRYFRPTDAVAIFLALRLTSTTFNDLLNDNAFWNPYLIKGARTKVPGQARDIFFKHPEHRLPYYRLLGHAGQNYLSERVGDILEIAPDLENQNISMTVIAPGANENSAVANYFRALTPSLFEPKTVNYHSPEWRRLLVSDLAPLADLSQLTGEQLFKWDSSPLQHLVATQQLTQREAHNLPIHMYYVLQVLADLRLVENNEINWAQIQQLTVEQIKLLLQTQVRNILRTYGIFQIENLLHFENGIAFFNSIQELLGTPNFCTIDEFLNLTTVQLSRIKSALPSIKSGKLSLQQCLSLTDEQYALFSRYSIPELLGTPNFCTIDEFLNLTPVQLSRIKSALPSIKYGKMRLKYCLPLTDERYELLSKNPLIQDLLEEPNFCTIEEFSNLTTAQLHRANRALDSIKSGKLSLKQCLSLTDEQYALFSHYSIPELLGTPNFCTIEEFSNLTPVQLSRVINALDSIKSGKLTLKQCLSLTDEQYALFSHYSIPELLGTPNFCTVEEFSNLTPVQLSRVINALYSIKSGKLSLQQCLSLTDEQYALFSRYSIPELLGTPNFCTIEEFSNLTSDQVRRVERALSYIESGKLSLQQCLPLTDEQYALFSNNSSIQKLLGTPNFCTVEEFSNLTSDQVRRVERALSYIESGMLSLQQCLSLTDEQYALFSHYSIPGLLGTPNFCTVDEFLNLTSDQVRRVESTLPFIQAGKLSLKECISLTDEQYALFSNEHIRLLGEHLTKEQILTLTPETLQRIAHPIVFSLICHGMSLDQALSTPETEYEGYRAIIIVSHITGHRSEYLSRQEAFSLTNEEVKNLAWTMALQLDRHTKLMERGSKAQVILEAHQSEVLRIAKALTSTQRKWLKAEALDTKNDEVPLEELFLQLSRLNLDAADAPTEAPTPSTQPTPAPT